VVTLTVIALLLGAIVNDVDNQNERDRLEGRIEVLEALLEDCNCCGQIPEGSIEEGQEEGGDE